MTLIASRSYTVISSTCWDVHPRGINAYQPSGPHPYFSSSSFSFVCLSLPLSSFRTHSTLWSCAHCIAKQALVPTNKRTAFHLQISAPIANAHGINKGRCRGQRCSFLPGDFNDTVVRCTDAGGPTMSYTPWKQKEKDLNCSAKHNANRVGFFSFREKHQFWTGIECMKNNWNWNEFFISLHYTIKWQLVLYTRDGYKYLDMTTMIHHKNKSVTNFQNVLHRSKFRNN